MKGERKKQPGQAWIQTRREYMKGQHRQACSVQRQTKYRIDRARKEKERR